MKIIRKGTPPSETLWVGTCQSCNSEAEANQSELKNIEHDQREGYSFCWMTCPVCGAGGMCQGMLFYPKKCDNP